MARLENWSTMLSVDSPYIKLAGEVYSHPNKRHYDGKRVVTSTVVELDLENKLAETYSGTKYQLGKPDNKWLDWLKENSPNYWDKVNKYYE